MRQKLLVTGGVLLTAMLAATCQVNTTETKGATETKSIAEERQLEATELIDRGRYLTTVGGCNDCHTPKRFGPAGMSLDSSRLFAGHAANTLLPPPDLSALKPGNWMQMSPEVTAFVGPWGTSYAANLTPDSATGIGAWSEEVFVKTLRTGKHLGAATGRPILPPMPWQGLASLPEEDLRAMYAYFKSLPPVNNKVPAPESPTDLAAKR